MSTASPPALMRSQASEDAPYLKLSEWPFNMLYNKTQTYAQWINYIMLASVTVVLFVLGLAARGEGCLAGVILTLFGVFAFWYWLAGRAGATSTTPMSVLESVTDTTPPTERDQWHRQM